MKYQKKDLFTTLTGSLMAIADSVPGISGGTVAYVLGKYDDFVGSVASISGKDKNERKKALEFLIKLGVGWIAGFVFAIMIIASLINEKPYELISLFLGFIIISIPFIVKQEGILSHIKLSHIILCLIGIILVIVVTSFTSTAIDLSASKSLLNYFYIFIVGILVLSCMLLPGISGSTFLLIFGIYMPIVVALKEIMKFNFAGLDIVMAFGFGALVGLFGFSKLVKYLLKKYRHKVVYFGVGLMIGSIYAVVMGPTTLADEATKVNLGLEPLNFDNFKIIWFLVGGAIIVSLERLKTSVEGGSKNA